jgi:hypothetical protein
MAEEFIGHWIKEIESGTGKHKESPALARIADSYNNIGTLPEHKVSFFSPTGKAPTHETRIIHLKSDVGRETIEKRINQPLIKGYVRRYLK